MLSESGRPTLAEGEPDPATPARRRELARAMLAAAIRHYDEAAGATAAAWESYPDLDRPVAPADEAEAAHRADWRRLRREAEADFDAAELALAARIKGLYDLVAPGGRKARDAPGEDFIPRAVRSGGTVYVLADDPDCREDLTNVNIVAVYREAMTIDLDAGPIADES